MGISNIDNIKILTLKNGDLEMMVTNFGCRVMKLFVPDRNGNLADVVLGYNTIDEYLNNKGERFLGAICGRFANRIAKGTFEIDGTTYNLPINNNGQTLHGGIYGVDSVVWDIVVATDNFVLFRYVSPDGEEGFPGTLSMDVTYKLTPDNKFEIKYSGYCDKKTPVNFTHHSFFNLKGEGNGTINDHLMQIDSDAIVPIDNVSIPTGELEEVMGTPFDFCAPRPIGSRLDKAHKQLECGAGIDHCFVLKGSGMRRVATVSDPISGRVMDVITDQPGMQFYGGNFFDGKTVSKDGLGTYDYRGSFALETQLFPDAPNQPKFESSILNPGEEYTHSCTYCFRVE